LQVICPVILLRWSSPTFRPPERNGTAAKTTIAKEVSTLVNNFTAIEMTVTNPAPTSGGDDAEDIASAKANAPGIFKSRGVATTKSDYESISGSYADPRYGRVAAAQAYVSRGAATDLVLQGSINTIANAVIAPVAPVAAAVTDGNSRLTTIGLETTAIKTFSDGIQVYANNIQTAATAVIANDRYVKNQSQEVVNSQNTILALTGATGTGGTARTFINSLAAGGSTQLSAADKITLLAYLDSVGATVNSTITTANQITTYSSATITGAGSINDTAALIGTTATRSLNTSMLKFTDDAVALIDTSKTALSSDLATINTQTSGAYTAVGAALIDIATHYSLILSDAAKTNLVIVPILSVDPSGFYQAPPSGLVESLQSYLDTIKEATQTVAVVSGGSFLLPAVITLRLGIAPDADRSTATIQQEASNLVDGLLKRRKAAAPLFVSDFDAVSDISGVDFFNVSIEGYLASDSTTVMTDRSDVDGNLIPGDGYTVTKGTTTINTEISDL
jgi:hypothetical protein